MAACLNNRQAGDESIKNRHLINFAYFLIKRCPPKNLANYFIL